MRLTEFTCCSVFPLGEKGAREVAEGRGVGLSERCRGVA